MIQYLFKRVLWLPVVLWAVSSMTFLALRIVPGNPIQTIQNQVMDRSQLAEVEAVWGLNRPISEQYVSFLSRLVRGDLGLSMSSGVPIRRMIFERMPPTIELAVVSLVISTGLGVLAGVASATIRNRLIDYGVRTLSILGLSLPLFWVGIMLIIVFSVNLRWTPTNGRIGPGVPYDVITNFMFFDLVVTGNWEAFGSYLRHLVLPGVTIGLTSAGFVARLTRSAMLEVISSDYVRTARAKGLHRARRHLATRDAQCFAADRHAAGLAVWRDSRRRGNHRARLFLSGHGDLATGWHPRARLFGGAGRHHICRAGLCADEYAGGYALSFH